MPVLSVIVPVYNVQNLLPECIESIMAQTFQSLELILVDDGSRDESGKICDDYAQRYPNIRVLHQKNSGQTAARKNGLRAALGTLISFIDSDDYLEPDMLEHMICRMEQYQADVVMTGYLTERSGQTVPTDHALPSGVYMGEKLVGILADTLFYLPKTVTGVAGALWCKLFRRETMEEIFLNQDERLRIGEDLLATFEIMLSSRCVVIDNDYHGYHYRIRNESVMHAYRDGYFVDIHLLFDALTRYCADKENPDLRKAAAYQYLFLFANGINQIMGRGNRVSWGEKYRMIRHVMADNRLQQAAAIAPPEDLPPLMAKQLQLILRQRPGIFVLHYFKTVVLQRLNSLPGR